MVNWAVFAVVCAVSVVAGVVAYQSTRLDRLTAEWDDHAAAVRPTSMLTVLAHVTADGEIIEYPIIRGESLISLATTLGEISALPEVAA